jgi:DNA polymerase (family 10)
MKNLEVAWQLEEIADLIEIRGIDAFKARAYRKAAAVVSALTVDIADLAGEGRLQELPGIGRSLAARIDEIIRTGTCGYLEDLKKEVPPSLRDLLSIPGVGARTAAQLYQELGIRTLEELEQAAASGRVRTLKGLSIRTEQRIRDGLARLRDSSGRLPLGIARPVAQELVAALSHLPEAQVADIAGSIRRGKEDVADIDIIAASDQPEQVMDFFCRLPQVRAVLERGSTKTSVQLRLGCQADLRVVAPSQYATARHHFTGSKEHNVRLRGLAKERGLKINEYGVFPADDDAAESLPVASEAELYGLLDMQYIPPELREDRGEVEAALAHELPQLVELGDIRGDLHCHTNWTDGRLSIPELAQAAAERGYAYVAVTDHSQALAMTGGLGPEKLARQGEAVAAAQTELGESIRLLRGIEVDIMTDGRLDLPDESLEQVDLVIASIHRGFRQTSEQLTGRIEAALKHPLVDIIAHPTGRLIGRRDEYPLDIERVIDVAAATGTALEINASPDRLDLSDINARRAGERGVSIAIDTDAHDRARLSEMEYGVTVARRAWREPADILNTKPLDELLTWLERPKG